MNKLPKITPKQIKNLRKIYGFTLDSLAVACGVSKRTVEGWEQGRSISLGCKFLLAQLEKEEKEKKTS